MRAGSAIARRVLVAAATVALSLLGAQAAAAAGGPAAAPHCERAAKAPSPPPGGAVFARPLQPGTNPNVVVIPAHSTWTPTGSCASAEEVMTHPGSIEVGRGGAVLLRGTETLGAGFPGVVRELFSAWGAKDDNTHPDLFPSAHPISWQKTTEARAVDPQYLLDQFASCRQCDLENVDYRHDPDNANLVAYERDLEGAHLQGSTLRGGFQFFNFSHADLRDANLSGANLFAATFNRTRVDGTDFDGASLMATQLTSLLFDRPPHLANVIVGGAPVCTSFKDTDLTGTGITLARIEIRGQYGNCSEFPLLQGSTAPLSVLAEAVKLGRTAGAKFNFDGATFVASAGDRAALAGADLSGRRMKGARFVGFPASLRKTDFRGSGLQDADFDGADLSGADFGGAKLAGASFREADLAAEGDLRGATFAGAATDLSRASFIDADISGASFVGADLSASVFSHALAEDTNFGGVRAPKAVFTGAHIYGNGHAFDSADNLRDVDFNGAVLLGDVDENGGFDLTHADLAGATFDGAQCIGCNFTGSTLDDANFIGAYLPGAIFADVQSMKGARLHDAWLYCGDRLNTACPTVGAATDRWRWPLALGSGEDYGPVPFRPTNLGNAPLGEVATCPDGKRGSSAPAGCEPANLLPAANHAPPIPAPCSAAGPGTCPVATSTLADTSSAAPEPGAPVALAAVSPADWAGTARGRGVYAAFGDGTIRLLEGRAQERIAGRPGDFCKEGPCGDGGPAKDALLGEVTGMAVGVDGSLYVADAKLHRVRRIDPSGRITTVAGSGRLCVQELRGDCGNSGSATQASLAGPFGVWVDPEGRIYIADGWMGVRVVGRNGYIGSVMSDRPDVHAVVGDASGDLYATTDRYLLKIDLEEQDVTRVVGTASPGFNGNKTTHHTLARGTDVQISDPRGLSVSRDGDILFADGGNDLIRAYVPSSGHVSDVMAGVVADGSPVAGFNGDGHYATETELDGPTAVASLADGEFVVADTGNGRVRKFGPGPR
ncbi:MAG TPA: pentapeptide repeat-containing protein [Solirubrobacterales bacterium]|nr:pentapeptide repeat-containing protein [Solirubrobacterales bacterium]